MRTVITTSLTLMIGLASTGTSPVLAQGAPQIEVPVTCTIHYAAIGIEGAGIPEEELVVDGPGQSAVANLRGTPPNEDIELVCTDLVGPQPSPIRRTGFPCDVFRGRRGGPEIFETTTNTSINIDPQGRVTMRCTTS